MTVKELKEKLEKFDDELVIQITFKCFSFPMATYLHVAGEATCFDKKPQEKYILHEFKDII